MRTTEARLREFAHSLASLSQDITQGELPDSSALKNLKLTVDELRLSLWAVITYEKQSRDLSHAGLRPKLAEFRMKRLMEMLGELQADFINGVLAVNPAELRNLTSALRSALQNLTPVRKPDT